MINAMAVLPPDMGDSFAAVSGKLVIQPQVALPIITPDSLGPYKDSVAVRKGSLLFLKQKLLVQSEKIVEATRTSCPHTISTNIV